MEYFPNPDEFRRKAQEGYSFIPVYATVLGDMETPITVFSKTCHGHVNAFLLESAVNGDLGRYSFIGARPKAVIRYHRGRLEVASNSFNVEFVTRDPLAIFTARYDNRMATVDGVPPFSGGHVGYIGYDVAREQFGFPKKVWDDSIVPALVFGIYDHVFVFDHVKRKIFVIVNADVSRDAAYQEACASIEAAVQLLKNDPAPSSVRADVHMHSGAMEIESYFPEHSFKKSVQRIQDRMERDSRVQFVHLSRLFRARISASPFTVYRALRSLHPSPYMFYVECGDFALMGASPCTLIQRAWKEGSQEPIPLHDGETSVDVFRRFFPSLSATGAYQHPAMQMIDEYEPVSRGTYGGAAGYFDSRGNAVFVPICENNILVKDGVAYTQVGGVVFKGSTTQRVLDETKRKAEAVFSVLRLAEAGLEF